MDSVTKKLVEHVDLFWPANPKSRFTWKKGPINALLPEFCVVRVEPLTKDQPWIYLTEGVWRVDMGTQPRLELLIVSPSETPRHVETLAMLAYFHSTPAHHLSSGKDVNIGHGWMEGSDLDRLLISLPYPFGPNLEHCKISDDLNIQYLWALPIAESESNYLRSSDLEALEQKFDEAGIDYLDPNRIPVV